MGNGSLTDGVLAAMQQRFQEVVFERAGDLLRDDPAGLPVLRYAPWAPAEPAYFAVPGMYGGFSYRFEGEPGAPRLVVESWCRVVEGSGQRHVITPDSTELVAEGFV